MSAQHGVTNPMNSDSAIPNSGQTHDHGSAASATPIGADTGGVDVPAPALVSHLRTAVLGTFSIAMITAVVLGVIVVVGQIVGIALGSAGVVTFLADYPSKVAFFAAGAVCVTSLISHYFPGAAAQEIDDH
jgi:hypothetical protein